MYNDPNYYGMSNGGQRVIYVFPNIFLMASQYRARTFFFWCHATELVKHLRRTLCFIEQLHENNQQFMATLIYQVAVILTFSFYGNSCFNFEFALD